ncbi:HNH endonuclease [Candidatus Dojkabacteria bacterium]|nr:HNH endonuclease [Candidatus Dojkabacteria bacterium]
MAQFQKGMTPWNKGKKLSLEQRDKLSKALKGRKTWNKGLKGKQVGWSKGLTKETSPMLKESGRKGGLTRTGKKLPTFTEEHKQKIGLSNRGKVRLEMRGEKHPNWKGGMGTERHQEMGKIEYKLWRSEVFERDNYTCQMCLISGVYLNADHIKNWAEFPELRFNIDNGQTLCSDCHYFKTFGKQKPKDIKWGFYNLKGANS